MVTNGGFQSPVVKMGGGFEYRNTGERCPLRFWIQLENRSVSRPSGPRCATMARLRPDLNRPEDRSGLPKAGGSPPGRTTTAMPCGIARIRHTANVVQRGLIGCVALSPKS